MPPEDELLLDGGVEDELLLAGGFELLELDEELGLIELDEELLEEAEDVEHSLLPPATRPPKVASLHTKLPDSTL